MNIVKAIIDKNYTAAKFLFEERMQELVYEKMNEYRKAIAASLYEDKEEEILDEGSRIRIVKARIRNGKIQRRKKVSSVGGYTMRRGKLTRMSPAERRKRKLGQRKGAIKRRGKMVQALRKRRRSLIKRRSFGG